MYNGDCRIPRANPNIKMLKRDDWDKLHATTYYLLNMLFPDDNWVDSFVGLGENEKVILERFAKEWRKHVALPTNVEAWIEERRNARANEPIG